MHKIFGCTLSLLTTLLLMAPASFGAEHSATTSGAESSTHTNISGPRSSKNTATSIAKNSNATPSTSSSIYNSRYSSTISGPYPSLATPIQYKYYTVQPGDTMTCAATRVYGRATFYMELASLNLDILDVDNLKAGQKLRYIPGREKKEFYDCRHKKPPRRGLLTYKVKEGNSLWTISKKLFGKGLAFKKRILPYNKELRKTKHLKPGMIVYYKPLPRPRRVIAKIPDAPEYGFGREESAIVPRSRGGDSSDNSDYDDADFSLLFYLGMSSISYNQTLIDASSESALNGRVAFQYKFKSSEFYTALNANSNFMPLQTQGPNTPFLTADGNLSFGHSLVARYPWKVILFVGGYAAAMFPTQGGIEYYKYLLGPQIYPVIQKQFKGGNTLSFNFKFVPLSNLTNAFELRNRYLSAGLTWTHDFRKGGSFSLLFDYANLLYTDISRPTSVGDTTLDTTAATLSIGFGF